MKRGFSLLEIVVALGLVSLCLYSMLSLLPTSNLSLRRAEDLQAATAYAQQVIETTKAQFPGDGSIVKTPVTLNGTDFDVTLNTVTLQKSSTGYSLHGIEVKMIRTDKTGTPIDLRTRVVVSDQ